jgi:hypothetical protein
VDCASKAYGKGANQGFSLKSFMWRRTLEFASYNFLEKKQVCVNVSTDVINFGLKVVYHMTIWEEKIYIN